MKKLSSAQWDVIVRMQLYKEQLVLIFPMMMRTEPYFELNDKRMNKATIDSLKEKNLIEYSHMTTGAITRHYYKLTEAGKNLKQ